MTAYDLLRSAYRHVLKSKKLAQEANLLSVAAMVEAKRAERLALEVEGKVMDAAAPHLERANQEARLSEFWAQEATEHAKKARLCGLTTSILQM
jgi:Holliday junction resolvasome RuvABC DNA-binding subunit